jgi:hypothetical protein
MVYKASHHLPKVGDRVEFHGEAFVVIEVNEETQSVSLVPTFEVETVPLDNLIPLESKRPS